MTPSERSDAVSAEERATRIAYGYMMSWPPLLDKKPLFLGPTQYIVFLADQIKQAQQEAYQRGFKDGDKCTEASIAKARNESLEEAANTRPSRSTMKHKLGDWYEVGWNDAVIEMDKTIRALKSEGK